MNNHKVYLSLGSNQGDRLGYIHEALRRIKQEMFVEQLSFMYQTDPVGFTDQGKFLNCVCKCSTDKNPDELLQIFETVMTKMGRVRQRVWGPRIIDIDILLVDDLIISSDTLTIPHPRMQDRAFVLEPLCDIDPLIIHPTYNKIVKELLTNLKVVPLQKVSQWGTRLFEWGTRTYVLGIVNATPDSFSGDGLIHKTKTDSMKHIQQLITDGADCLDIGAMSSRPGHELISESEELERLIPVIKQVREITTLPISVDTFRANVAEVAIQAGANVINSIWGAEYDPEILTIAVKYEIPLILTVNRSMTHYFSTEKPLMGMIQEALRAGVYPWNIIIDPGIGFVRTSEENSAIIRNLSIVATHGYPVLVGASRKKFIRDLIGSTDNSALIIPNVVIHTAMARMGASMVRVHDVGAVVDGLRISDTLGI